MLRIMMKPQGPGQPPMGPGQPPMPPGAGPTSPPMPGQPPLPPDPTQDPDKDQDKDSGQCQTSQQIAGYMGPENGPFECERCKHFQEDGSCDLVAGKIDPEGCCNLFEPDPSKQDTDTDDDEAPGYPDVASLLKGQ